MVSCKEKCSVPLFPSLLLAALVGLSVAGCVYIPPIGRQIGEEDLRRISVGTTTRTEVLDLLGEPLIHAGRFMIAVTYSSSGELVTLPPFWINYEPLVIPLDASSYQLFLRFDDRDVVDRFDVVGSDGNRAPFGAVQPLEVTTPENAALPRKTIFREEGSFWGGGIMFNSLAISRDGTLIAASDTRGEALIENIRAGQPSRFKIQEGGDWNGVNSLAFSADGKRLYAVTRTVGILEVPSGKQIGLFSGHGDEIFWRCRGATALAVAPDGRTVATGGCMGEVKLWDAATTEEKLAFKAHDDWVSSVAFSPDGSLLATASIADGSVRLWDPTNGSEHVRIPRKGPADIVAFSPSGEHLAIATRGHVEVWRVLSRQGPGQGRPEPVVEGPVEMFFLPFVDLYRGRTPSFRGLSVVFSPDGRLIAACTGGVSIWDLETSQQVWRLVPGGEATTDRPPGSGRIYDCAFSPDGRYLATAGTDGVHLWDLTGLVPKSAHFPRSISSADPARRSPVSP